jgi:hypothetical protein
MPKSNLRNQCPRLCDHGAGSGALISPGWWKNTNCLVVAGQAVDTGLDQNKAELGVFVLSVALEVLADGNGLLGVNVSMKTARSFRNCIPS